MGQTLDKISFYNLWPTTLMMTTYIEDVAVLQDEIYKIASVPNDIKKSNYGGWQSDVDLYKNPVFKPLCDFIADTVTTALPASRVKFHQMWACINKKHDQNGIHSHSNLYDLSGVYYVQVPPNSGEIVFRDPRPGAIHSSNKLSVESEHYTPFDCMMLIFPSWLEHWVWPNKSDDDRISISFDITLEK